MRDRFEDAARAEAEAREMEAQHSADQWARRQGWALTGTEVGAYEQGHLAGSAWSRDHLAEVEPSDAEVLAALNAHLVSGSPRANPAPSLDGYYAPENIDAMRAVLRAAARARKEQER